MSQRSPHLGFGLLVAAVAFILDQLAKWVVTVPLSLETQPGRSIEFTSFFNLTWAQNYGISLSMFSDQSPTTRWILVAVTAAVAIGVAVWMTREKAKGDVIALALILGGALGNLVDRLRFGHVVDFLDFHAAGWHWPAFNVADSGITVGALLLILDGFAHHEKRAGAPS
jgi:signal peptidase II